MPRRSLFQFIAWFSSFAALAAVAIVLTAASLRSIWGVDFWWQYATGRYVAEHGPPTVDVFTYTRAGQPWIELRWLYCLVLYLLVQAFGYAGPVIAKWLVLACSFTLAAAAARRPRALTATAVVLLMAVMAASQRYFVRPELVTFLMLALFIWIIHRWRCRGGWIIWLLPALQIIWTNAHTLFILGPLLAGLALAVAVAERIAPRLAVDTHRPATTATVRTAGIVTALTFVACLVNPWLLDGFLFPFQLFTQIRGTVFKQYITEFRSPFAFEQSYAALWWYKALIGLCIVSAIANVRRLSLFWTVLLLSQLYLSTLAIRNIPLFAVAAVPFVIDNVDRGWLIAAVRGQRAAPWCSTAAAVVVVAVSLHAAWRMVTDRAYVYAQDTNHTGLGLARHRYPLDAIRFMQRNGITGPVLHTFAESGPLLAHGFAVQFDPRLEVHGGNAFSDYWQMFEDPSLVAERQAEFGWQAALIGLQSSLINALQADPDWQLVHFDAVAAVFVRRDAFVDVPRLDSAADMLRAVSQLRTDLPSPQPPFAARGPFDRIVSPLPYIVVADALQVFGEPRLALSLLDDARAAWPQQDGLDRRFALAHQNAGLLEDAITDWRSMAEREPDNAEPPYRLGVLFARLGRTDDAAEQLAASLERLEANPHGWALLGRMRAQQGRTDEAVAALRRAAELAPGDPDHQRNLARAFINARRFNDAEQLLAALLEQSPDDPLLYRDLALTAANAGDAARALAIIDRGLAAVPGHTALTELRAMIRRQFNLDPDEGGASP